MNKLEDAFEREIKLGDYVSYSVRLSTGLRMHIGKVWKITWEHNRYRIGVISTGNRWDWNRPRGERYYYGGYKTTLTANGTLLIVTNVPDKVKDTIEEYERNHYS